MNDRRKHAARPPALDTGPDNRRARCLIATALNEAGQEWTPKLRQAIGRSELFNVDGRLKIAAEAINAASTDGIIPSSITISEHLPKAHRDLIFSFQPAEALPLSIIEIEAETFLENALPAGIEAVLGESWQAIKDNPKSAKSIAAHTITALERIAVTSESLGDRLAARLLNLEVEIPRPTPRFSIGRVTISTAGNITTLSGQAKHGKSSALTAMIASTFCVDGADTLGFNSANPQGHAVLHLDSEQSPFDHQEMIHQLVRRAGSPLPPWVKSYCLTGMSADEIRAAIPVLMEAAKKEFGGIFSVFLDGAADAANDVNDAAESNSLVSEFHALAIKYSYPLICVIHLNPGSDFKTRGHLGSQLERKAETNLKCERDDSEAITLWAEKNRHAPILKSNGPRFAWSDDAGMHITIESRADARANAEFDELSELFGRAFSSHPAMSFTELKTTVKKAVTVGDRTAERKITKAVTLGIIKKTFAGLYEYKGNTQ